MEIFLLMILILILPIVMLNVGHRNKSGNLSTEDKAKLIAYMIRHENDD